MFIVMGRLALAAAASVATAAAASVWVAHVPGNQRSAPVYYDELSIEGGQYFCMCCFEA